MVIVHDNYTILRHATNAAGWYISICVGPGADSVTMAHTIVTGSNDHGIFVQDAVLDPITDNTAAGSCIPASAKWRNSLKHPPASPRTRRSSSLERAEVGWTETTSRAPAPMGVSG